MPSRSKMKLVKFEFDERSLESIDKLREQGRLTMNHITVVAAGAPNSFARRVQENPQIAVDLLRIAKVLYADLRQETFYLEDVEELGKIIDAAERK